MTTLTTGLRIYSCDDHLDLGAVPVDLWETRLPSRLVERGPRVVEHEGVPTWFADGKSLGPSGVSPAGALNAITRAGLDDDGFRASDPTRRLADMDRDHVQASVIYGPSVFGLAIDDPELKQAAYAAYNDFGAEFNAYDPERLCLLARLPGHDAGWVADELVRCASLGHRGAILEVFGVELADPGWDRAWAAAAEVGLPISFHLGGGTGRLTYGIRSWRAPAYATVAPMQLDEPFVSIVFSGALERHPGLRIVLAESGIGWLPYVITRMDHEWRQYRGHPADYELHTAPSELVRRQVMATFEEEPLGPMMIPLVGVDNVMWASDYPHPDSTFPDSLTAIAQSLAGFDDADVRRIVAGNCAELYGFGG